MAGPLREGGGGEGRAMKEKKTFFETCFFIFLPFKKKKLFYFRQLMEIWSYHVKVCR